MAFEKRKALGIVVTQDADKLMRKGPAKVLEYVRLRHQYAKAFRRMARYIHDSGFRIVFTEGDTAEYTWAGVSAAWKTQYENIPLPQRIRIPSTIINQIKADSHSVDRWVKKTNRVVPTATRTAPVILTDSISSMTNLEMAWQVVQRLGFPQIHAAALSYLRKGHYKEVAPSKLSLHGSQIFVAASGPLPAFFYRFQRKLQEIPVESISSARRKKLLKQSFHIASKIGARSLKTNARKNK